MSIEVDKEKLNINQIVGEKSIIDTVETDCIVPDVKPDAKEIIGTSGVLSVYKKELTEGKIRIDGSVMVYIMYYGKTENSLEVRSINHTLDFSEIMQIENVTSEMLDETEVTLQNVECKIINERKINIKASVNYSTKVYSNKTEEYISNVKLNDIQKLEKKQCVKVLAGAGETKTSVSEKVQIAQTDELAEILKVSCNFTETDTKVSYNKVMTKSNLNLKMLYLTEDNRIVELKKVFPIMGFVEMKDIKETATCTSKLYIKNVVLKPEASKDHNISVDFEIGIKVFAYESKEINIIEDMYSTSKNLNFTQKNIKAISSKSVYQGNYSFSQKQNIGITNEKVIDIEPSITSISKKQEDGAVLISGNAEFAALLANDNFSEISVKRASFPFNYKMVGSEITSSSEISLSYYFRNENYNILPGGEVDFKTDIVFEAVSTCTSCVKLVNNVTENSEKTRKANMVIYFTKEGDTLWSIGKRFQASASSIKETNTLESDKISAGKQLYII